MAEKEKDEYIPNDVLMTEETRRLHEQVQRNLKNFMRDFEKKKHRVKWDDDVKKEATEKTTPTPVKPKVQVIPPKKDVGDFRDRFKF